MEPVFTFITPSEKIDCPRMFRDFSTCGVTRAELRITGLGLYRAFLNGRRVGEDYLTPGCNDYDAYLRYQTYDVTALLQQQNTLEVYLGKGWYMGRFGFGEHPTERYGSRYLLAAELTWTDTAGEAHMLRTDDSWQASQTAFVDNSIYDGEVRDDTRTESPLVPCTVAETPYRPEAQFSPCIRMRRELPASLIVTPKGEQVLDFGQNFAGVFRFVNRAPRGQKVYIQTGEVLQEGCFYRDNLRSAKSEFTYISDGTEKEIEPMFTFYGFRYMKVEGMGQIDPADFIGVCLSSALEETLEVETGNPKINRLMQNALWGQRSNFLDVPTDCPQRDERLGWTADTQVFVNTACYQMDCKDFYRKFMRDMRADQTMYLGGDIPMFSPVLKNKESHGGAVWADAGTIVPWNVYMAYGDEDLLRENYPMMKDYVEYLIAWDQSKGGTHLVFDCHTFGDWLALDGKKGTCTGGTKDEFIQSTYYMYSAKLTAGAAKVLGYTEDAARYAALAEDIRQAMLKEYVTAGGNLAVPTQTGFVLALIHGIYTDKDKLLKEFRRRLDLDSGNICAGFTGAPLMLMTLFDNGMEKEAFDMLLNENYPGWLYCVNLGATTVWERWNTLDAEGRVTDISMNSMNHYAYGSVCESIYSRIMGLQNAAPGWKKAVIHPRPDARLGHASIRYASVSGIWAVKWALAEDGTVTMDCTVPEGCTARVELPDRTEEVTAGTRHYTWKQSEESPSA